MVRIRNIIYVIICVTLCFFYIFFVVNYGSVFHTQPVPVSPSVINIIDWKPVILKMLQEVFFFENINNNNVLLVNVIKNNTNGKIQTHKITNLLINCIIENVKKYKVIRIEQLYFAYRKLGVFPEDSINSYGFSIDIAHYLKADYLLYSIVYGDVLHPIVELQLIFVKTGEIISVVNTDVVE